MTTTSGPNRTGIDGLPRVALGRWPTPLHRLDHLSEALGIDLWIKRDDLTTLALGGNKVRKLEFLLGDVVAQGCDTVVTTGGSQSNHARLTAAACTANGLQCHLVLDRGRHPEGGNLMLDGLFGAEVHLIDDGDPAVAVAEMDRLAQSLTSEGRKPYVIPRGGSIPQGAVGYASMVGELSGQLEQAAVSPDTVFVATGSCGTHSGIMAGRALTAQAWRVQGVSVSRPRAVQEARVLELANQTLSWMGADPQVTTAEVMVDDGFAGPGYGVPTMEAWEAITVMARREAIVLDPVYTAKAFAGLMAHARGGLVPRGATVVFVHTGGSPALFSYTSEAPFAS